MKRKIYYIETTLNGYIIKKIEICDWVKDKDYIEDLKFEYEGEMIDYYECVAGDLDDLETFLKYANSTKCENYDDILGGKPNVYLEYWLTNVLGYFTNKYVGLMIV